LISKKTNFSHRKLSSIKFSFWSSNEDVAICAAPRATFGADYRLSLDRHMQLVIGNENWDYSPRSSSVLSIRNVTEGLTIYNNVFKENAAETGTALFVHNFKNTQGKEMDLRNSLTSSRLSHRHRKEYI